MRRAPPTLSNDRDRHASFEPRLPLAGRHADIIEVAPAFVIDTRPRLLEEFGGQQLGEVVAVDPLHLHDADSPLLDEVLHIEQIVLLDLGNPGGHRRDAVHRLHVELLGLIPLWRENLEGHRQCEVAGALPLGQVDHALTASPQPPGEGVVFGPVEAA